jgi:hypothetical protein
MRFIPRLGLAAAALLAACHSSHIDVTVKNSTGAPVRLLEVDYPSASFGSDALAPGANMHYRIQVQGTGQLKVQYTGADSRPVQINGPTLAEHQDGALDVDLLPAGKADFHLHLSGSTAQ